MTTVSAIKSDLRRQLPVVVSDMRKCLREQIDGIENYKDKYIQEINELFQLEMSPIVQSLQNALESQGNIDAQYDEKLQMLRSMLESAQQTCKDLLERLEK